MQRRALLTASASALLASACGASTETAASSSQSGSPRSTQPTSTTGASSTRKQKGPSPLREALGGATSLRMMRLNPSPQPTGGTVNVLPPEFHGYRILEQAELRDAAAIEELLALIFKGIEGAGDEMVACFNPRHGISVVKPQKTVDLVICFECLQIKVFDGGETSVGTTKSVEPAVNEFFAARMK